MVTENNRLPTQAIVFVPGFSSQEQGYTLNLLAQGFQNLEIMKIQELGEAQITGHTGRRFIVNSYNNSSQTIDIYEAFWLDIFFKNRLSNNNLQHKFFNGFSLLLYWFFSPVWKSFLTNPYLTVHIITSLLLLLLWYSGIVLLVMKAIGESGTFFGQPLPSEWVEFIGNLGGNMSSLSVWIIVSIILTFYPVDPIIDIFWFVKKYLAINAHGINLRGKIRQRIIPIIEDVLANYQKVTIVSHSFGVMISTDILADYQNSTKLNYLTLGGVLQILSYQSKWILREIDKCCNNQVLLSWNDYYSKQDWFAAKTPQPKAADANLVQIKSHEIPVSCSMWEQLSGKTHSLYLYNPTWILELLKLKD